MPINDSLIIFPRTEAEIINVIRKACQTNKKIIVNQQTPLNGMININLRDFNKIIELDENENMITVEAGIKIDDLSKLLKKRGYILPVENLKNKDDTVADAFMNGEDGMYCQYPHAKNLYLGTKVVFPDIGVCRFGGKFIKNVTGYDINKILFGSRFMFCIPLSFVIRLYKLEEFSKIVTIRVKNNVINKLTKDIELLKPFIFNIHCFNRLILVTVGLKSIDKSTFSKKEDKLRRIISKYGLNDVGLIDETIKNQRGNMVKINCDRSISSEVLRTLSNIESVIVYSHYLDGEFFVYFNDNKLSQIKSKLTKFNEDEVNYSIYFSRSHVKEYNNPKRSAVELKIINKLKNEFDKRGILV